VRTILARNVHQALPQGLQLLDQYGYCRDSRNGPVIVAPGPVATTYQMPEECVVFWPQRDANPFLHLYEALWMLDGRNDLAPLLRYTKQYAAYSDDGKTLHDAYGYRWRRYFAASVYDQLNLITDRLRRDQNDRRCVLTMWDPRTDLGRIGKAVPCNLTATLQRDREGRLDMTVFCRSNDMIWGAYGANAVTFSVLLGFLASEVSCPVGQYTQISVNFHAYREQYEKLRTLPRDVGWLADPYSTSGAGALSMSGVTRTDVKVLLYDADSGFESPRTYHHPWVYAVGKVLLAHHLWRTLPAPDRFDKALDALKTYDGPILPEPMKKVDWIVAAKEWIERRKERWFDSQEDAARERLK
jgi:thymidylate synthase